MLTNWTNDFRSVSYLVVVHYFIVLIQLFIIAIIVGDSLVILFCRKNKSGLMFSRSYQYQVVFVTPCCQCTVTHIFVFLVFSSRSISESTADISQLEDPIYPSHEYLSTQQNSAAEKLDDDLESE